MEDTPRTVKGNASVRRVDTVIHEECSFNVSGHGNVCNRKGYDNLTVTQVLIPVMLCAFSDAVHNQRYRMIGRHT